MDTGPLKRAAILSWMASQGKVMSASGYGYSMTVTPPGPDGEGGGTVTRTMPDGTTVVSANELRPAWDQICAEIESTLAPFDYLPDPWRFDDLIDDLAIAARQLMTPAAIDAINQRGGSSGGGPITDSLSYIADTCSGLEGETIYNFQTKFLGALGRTLTSCYNITLVLGAGLAGEKELWTKTPKSVQAAINKATSAFGGPSMSWDELKDVLGVMEAGLSLFAAVLAPEITGAVVAGALASGVSFVKEVGTAWHDSGSSWYETGFDKAMGAFKNDVAGLLDSIRQQESLLRQSLQSTTCEDSLRLSNQLSGLDADGEARYDDLGDFNGVQWDSDQVRKITQDALPEVAGGLTKAAAQVGRSSSVGPWLRDYRVGLTDAGCFSDWDSLQARLQDLLADLAWQTQSAAALLQLASDAFATQSQAAADALRSYAQQIAGGYVRPPSDDPARWTRVPGGRY